MMAEQPNRSTQAAEYTRTLIERPSARWKRFLDVQRPYRWNLRRLRPAFTLEVGCGIGRNLAHLRGQSIGVDHNPHSVAVCRKLGHVAFTPAEFQRSSYARSGTFDSLLFAHVAEHMNRIDFAQLVEEYAGLLKHEGRLIVITPQEAGFRSDPTHVEFFDFGAIRQSIAKCGFEVVREYSFPFPRFVGRVFPYNEFISISRRATAAHRA